MDARIARTAQVTLDPRVYRTQLLDLAVDRFDVWAERGFAVVSTEETRHAYECWLANYVTNWLRYVAETCPRVDMRDELERRLRKRSEAWSGRALGPSHESPLHAKATPI
jgi:phage terminase Nu1 subunit (DNA packaging protein)